MSRVVFQFAYAGIVTCKSFYKPNLKEEKKKKKQIPKESVLVCKFLKLHVLILQTFDPAGLLPKARS